jgi:hypothetical protein
MDEQLAIVDASVEINRMLTKLGVKEFLAAFRAGFTEADLDDHEAKWVIKHLREFLKIAHRDYINEEYEDDYEDEDCDEWDDEYEEEEELDTLPIDIRK